MGNLSAKDICQNLPINFKFTKSTFKEIFMDTRLYENVDNFNVMSKFFIFFIIF